jgi:predicted transcriptional regulator
LEDKGAEYKELAKVFSPQQLDVLSAIVAKAVAAIEWHNGKDSDAHPNLEEKVNDLAAKFRNHRHETGKTFSAKPEY